MTRYRLMMVGATAGSILSLSHATAVAETTITFNFDSSLDMVSPEYIPNITAKDKFVIVLKEDGSISEQNTALGGRVRPEENQRSWARDYRLGQPSGNGGLWHVVSQNVLMRTNSFSHNNRSMTVTITGASCRVRVVNKLKPGFSTYSFPRASNGQWAEFSRVTIGATSCSIR